MTGYTLIADSNSVVQILRRDRHTGELSIYTTLHIEDASNKVYSQNTAVSTTTAATTTVSTTSVSTTNAASTAQESLLQSQYEVISPDNTSGTDALQSILDGKLL